MTFNSTTRRLQKQPLFVLFALAGRNAAILDVAILCAVEDTRCKTRKLPKVVQDGALCSVMGMDCVKVMNSLTSQTAYDKKDPENILSALSDHLMPKKHVV